MKRVMLLLAVLAASLAAGNAQATPPVGVSATTLIRVSTGEVDIVLQRITIAPGGTTGWHTHPGPAYVSLMSGTMSFYSGDDPTCTAQLFGPGGGFVDPGRGHVHVGRNEGSVPVELFVIYTLPPGAVIRVDANAPGNCPF